MKKQIQFDDRGFSVSIKSGNTVSKLTGPDVYDVQESPTGLYEKDKSGNISPISENDYWNRFASEKQLKIKKDRNLPMNEMILAMWDKMVNGVEIPKELIAKT